jgi:hypothetical protein
MRNNWSTLEIEMYGWVVVDYVNGVIEFKQIKKRKYRQPYVKEECICCNSEINEGEQVFRYQIPKVYGSVYFLCLNCNKELMEIRIEVSNHIKAFNELVIYINSQDKNKN